MDRVISVEYAVRRADERRNVSSPDRRGRELSTKRNGYGRGRSPSPYHRDRDSPDYGRGSNVDYRPAPKGSPVYNRGETPINERYPSSQSPPQRERSWS